MNLVDARTAAMRPPAWLVALKLVLASLLVCGALFPEVGGFEGKGMAFRLPIFLAPALIVPLRQLIRGAPSYPAALDTALTLPFLLDTAANGIGLYDNVASTDDVLHFVNWFVLIAGIGISLKTAASKSAPPWLVWLSACGTGALLIVLWEAAEYAVMRAGVGGLSLTYGDTVADLLLSTAGGALGAAVALRVATPKATAIA